jgi:hypothetical protein
MTIIRTNKELRPRENNDFYPTPVELCEASLNLLPEDLQPYNVLDPGSGTGNWGKAFVNVFENANIIYFIDGVELTDTPINPVYARWFNNQDFLNFEGYNLKYDLIMGNPPYKFAEEFVRKSLNLLDEGGCILFLLRLSFLESMKRGRGLFKEFPPKEVHVCMRRPNFYPEHKGTGDTAYAIYIWQKDYKGETLLKWLDWNHK